MRFLAHNFKITAMYIDIFSYVIFNITVTALMTFSLFFVRRGYLGELKELRMWTIASTLQLTGWLITISIKFLQLPESVGCGAAIILLLSLVCYFHALVKLKQSKISVKWAYQSLAITFLLLLYFSVFKQSIVARLIIVAIYSVLIGTASSFFLLSKRYSLNGVIPPSSYKLAGYIFMFFTAVMFVRGVYYSVVPIDNPAYFANTGIMQDITYLTFSILSVGVSFGFLLMCVDKYVGKQKQVEHDLRIAAAAFQTQEGIMITDAKSVILNVNQSFTEITGYSVDDVVGQTPRILQSGGHDKEFYAVMWDALLNKGAWQGEIWNKRKNGQIYPQYLTITAVKNDDAVTNYVSTITDITDRKANEETIRNLSFYDSLTELPNRRLLEQRIKHAIEINRLEGKKIAVLIMDLDKFKTVNDTFGHKAGDDLLKQVAARIQACLPEKEMVARLGSDEFVIVLEEVNALSDIEDIANTVIQTISQPFTLFRGDEVCIGVSIGIAMCIHPMHGYDVETLLDHADIALYHSKDSGAGCFTYFSEEFLS